MSFVSYVIPQILGRFSSTYNSDIRVVEESGKPKLLVNGSRQSGRYIEWLWRKAFSSFPIGQYTSILVLGVGGGTVIHMLSKLFPDVHITGVDIDAKMIEIGKKYFGLSQIRNLKLIAADAKSFKTTQYDFVIVDLFIGRHIPDFVSSEFFLKRLKGKTVVINYLRELEYLEKSKKLEKQLKNVFGEVRDYQIERNRFFFARG